MPTYLRRKEKFRLFHFRLFAVVAIMALSAIFLLMGSLALRIIALFLLVGVLVIPYFRKSFDRALLLPIFLIFFIFLLYVPAISTFISVASCSTLSMYRKVVFHK